MCQACSSCFSCITNLLKHRRVRPDSCGLPQYDGLAKCAPRARAKIDKGGRRKVKSEIPKDEQHILPDDDDVDNLVKEQFMSEEDVVMNIEIEYTPGEKSKETQMVDGQDDEFDISFIEKLDDDAEQWPEAVSYLI